MSEDRGATVRALFVVGMLMLGGAGCRTEPENVEEGQSAILTEVEEAPRAECELEGASCLRHGRSGTCLRQRCVLPSGTCSYDVDCFDGNECSATRCNAGTCEVSYVDGGSCDEGAGVCRSGACVKPVPASCSRERECKASAPACTRATCEEGTCAFEPMEDGASCRLPSQLPGRCRNGTCTAGEIRTDRGERCQYVLGPYGVQEECKKRTRFALEPAEMEREAQKIARQIRDDVLYDVEVRLVPLADGGNNILVFNRHSRSEVKGLVDPSFIAFEVAQYTEESDWKSRMLHVWIDPYEEGWQISTRGGRDAVKHGREASLLGALGVVHIKAFREWLQRSFKPLPRPEPELLEGVAAAEAR